MYTVRDYSCVGAVPSALWRRCGGELSPFTSHGFLCALEASGCLDNTSGWRSRPLLIYHGTPPVLKACVPFYLKAHSQGEFVFDHAWAHAAHQAGIAYYPKGLVASPFTPVAGNRLLLAEACQPHEVAPILRCLADFSASRVSSLHLTFLPPEQAREAENSGYLTRLGIQFHWYRRDDTCFDDFLARLPSRKRKAIKKEREKAHNHGLRIAMESPASLTDEDWRRFYAFYRKTIDDHGSYAYLTAQLFPLLAETMPERILMATARDNKGVLQAGALHVRDGKRLYGRYWGCARHCAFVHFELCYYQAIAYAIEHGLDAVEAGAQGGHKLLRGYEPTLTYSSHMMHHEGLHRAVKAFLQEETRAIRQTHKSLHQQYTKTKDTVKATPRSPKR
ncbi:MAG: N-acetyltransferase [Alphaproteobacteria bacterium GM202ARS2]|nr:N-acetyltransferase [Alphaproteobacteria bacterium GM202ARS2]